ncbi:AAA family ATPase [Devosia albogilva]|uniref:AAA family ATPase n=1 Tax=Devosia albogilva TaxID=429726 RepID=A0ABW5QNG2_9HYPH
MWTPAQDRKMDAFESILVDHPRKTQLHSALGNLMHETTRASRRYQERAAAAGGRPLKAEELYLLPVIGPSGATKTKSLSTYVDRVLADPDLDPDEIPVLVVTVRSSVKSARHLQSAILLAFGDLTASTEVLSQRDYSEARVNMDLLEKARAKKTRIVILDECHSMIQNAGPVLLDSLATAMKSFVNDGLFSLVLVGTDKVKRLLQFSENHSRQKRIVDFGPASLDDPEDVAYFMQFVGRFEKEMLGKKVISKPLNMIGDVATRAIVYDMARGVVGTVVRILRIALEQSFEDDQPLDWTHIAKAFRAWNRALEKPGPDPFASKNASKATETKLEAVEGLSMEAAE